MWGFTATIPDVGISSRLEIGVSSMKSAGTWVSAGSVGSGVTIWAQGLFTESAGITLVYLLEKEPIGTREMDSVSETQ
jgi:hypothetical protein